MNTKNLQSYIVLKSLDTPLPDVVAGKIGELLPAFEINVDEEGKETRGAEIPNGTYRQRIVCNHLAPIKLWSDADQCQRVSQTQPTPYNPAKFDALGQSITPSVKMVGNSYYLIPFIRVAGIDDALSACRAAWKQATGQELDEPEGYAIERDMVDVYFQPEDNEL